MTLNDILVVDGGIDTDASELDYYLAVQRAINNGLWSMPGRTGRALSDAMREGRCMLGQSAARDAYGRAVPARDEVEEGTVGSYGLVAQTMGDDWAAQMAAATRSH